MVVAIIFICKVSQMPSGDAAGTKWDVGYTGLVYIGPFGRLFEFTLGMALALVFPRMKAVLSLEKPLEQSSRRLR